MKEKQEIELLLNQRNQLVEALAKVDSVFQKTMLAFLTGLVSIMVAENLEFEKIFLLFLLQLILMLVIFIELLLISGNMHRYYICAIDDYLYEQYEITALFYEGNVSKDHIIGLKSMFSIATLAITIIAAVVVVWIVQELGLLQYIRDNVIYIILTAAEVLLILSICIYNIIDKMKGNKEYKDCLKFLTRDQQIHNSDVKKKGELVSPKENENGNGTEHNAESEQAIPV